MKQSKYIEPLYMAGLQGRMLRMPADKGVSGEYLLVGGHHTSLERMYGFAEYMTQFGNITMPDLPGFGGMESFYKIGIVPSIDSYADYLAAFIKLRYKRKKVVLVGFSYSVPVFVRMLQKYPELQTKVSAMVSVVGFVHHEDFKLSKAEIFGLRTLGLIGGNKYVSLFIKHVVVRASLVRLIYKIRSNRHNKVKNASDDDRKRIVDMEVSLWLANDLRTWFVTMREMFRVDALDSRIQLNVLHINTSNDIYMNGSVVEQHLNVIFDKVKVYLVTHGTHAPSVVATKEEVAPFFPPALKKALKRLA